MFLPDRNLGGNVSGHLGRNVDKWPGFCPVHDCITTECILQAKADHPNAFLMVHPECRPEVVALADAALSTGAMLKFVASSDHGEFLVGTETGILHRMRRDNPGKTFYPLQPEPVCPDMKKITLEDVRNCLKDLAPEVILDDDVIRRACVPIQRMLDLA